MSDGWKADLNENRWQREIGKIEECHLSSITLNIQRSLCVWIWKEYTILAVKMSFPRRANNPRPSAAALRCDAQMSPPAIILCSNQNF